MTTPYMPEIVGNDDVLIEKTDTVWSGRYKLQIVRFSQRRFDGSFSPPRDWELWRRGRAVALLPYDPVTDQVVLIEQFRIASYAAGFDGMMVEIPAGMIEPGEEPIETITREAEEEAGLAILATEPIGEFVLTPGGCDERIALFAGRVTAPASGDDGIAGHHGLISESEDIRVRVWPAERAIAEAVAGRMPNSVTTIALLWLAARRDKLRQDWSAA